MTGRTTCTHELKTWPPYFEAILDGRKRFELRQDDRPEGFEEGDFLNLREWDPNTLDYTGRSARFLVAYVLRPGDFQGALADGYVIMSIEREEK